MDKNQNISELPKEGIGHILLKMPVVCHELDDNGLLIDVSDEWLSTFGYQRQDVVGKEFTSFLSEKSSQKLAEMTTPELSVKGRFAGDLLEIVRSDGVLQEVLYYVLTQSGLEENKTRVFGVIDCKVQPRQASSELQAFNDELEKRVRSRTAALNKAYEQLIVEMKERKRAEIILRTIAEGVYGTTGVTFFTSLVQFLTKALDMDHAFIALFDEENKKLVHTLAVCSDGKIGENFSYDLAGTPCSKTSEQGMGLYPKKVKDLFPTDDILQELMIESYIGTRLNDSSGTPVGLLVVMSRSPVEASGTVTSMLQIYASRVAAEIERLQQEEELMRVRNLESLGRMAAGIAHEVNNPLTNASINIQMLRKNLGFLMDETPILKRVEAVERNIERASNIAKELLLFSRQKDLELAAVNINAVIEKAFTQITHDLENITIEMNLSDMPEVLGDSIKLEGLFINLFNNAIDAMPNGGCLSVASSEEGGKVIVRIHDTGHGIEKENLSRVFEPFFTTKEVGKGTGLGLSIAYGIVRQHKGSIEVVDTQGKGTSLIVKIPVYDKGAL